MRQVLTRVFAVCVAAAGLILAVPYAEAGPAPATLSSCWPLPAATTYYNLTGQNCNGADTPGSNISAEIQGTSTDQRSWAPCSMGARALSPSEPA